MVKRVYFYFFMYPSRPWLSLPRYPYPRVLSTLNNPFLPRGLKEIPPRTRPMRALIYRHPLAMFQYLLFHQGHPFMNFDICNDPIGKDFMLCADDSYKFYLGHFGDEILHLGRKYLKSLWFYYKFSPTGEMQAFLIHVPQISRV